MPLANPRLRRLGERPSPLLFFQFSFRPIFILFWIFLQRIRWRRFLEKFFEIIFPPPLFLGIAPYNIFRDDPLALVSSGAATWLLRAGTAATRFENKSRRKERNWLSRLAAIPPGMLIVRNRIENRKPTLLVLQSRFNPFLDRVVT